MGIATYRCHKCQESFSNVESLRKHSKDHPSTKRKDKIAN